MASCLKFQELGCRDPWDFCRWLQFRPTGVVQLCRINHLKISQVLTLMSQIPVPLGECLLANCRITCWFLCAPRHVLPRFGQVSQCEDRRISRWQAAEECPKAHSTRRESARGASEKKPPQLDAIYFLLSERRDRIGFFFPNLGFGSSEYL